MALPLAQSSWHGDHIHCFQTGRLNSLHLLLFTALLYVLHYLQYYINVLSLCLCFHDKSTFWHLVSRHIKSLKKAKVQVHDFHDPRESCLKPLPTTWLLMIQASLINAMLLTLCRKNVNFSMCNIRWDIQCSTTFATSNHLKNVVKINKHN